MRRGNYFNIALIVALLVGIALALRFGASESAPRRHAATHSPTLRADRKANGENRPRIRSWVYVEDFDQDLAVFESVFWDSRDTVSLRQLIRGGEAVRDKTVLEIGTGTGLISLCCLKSGASRALATDVNRDALANARYNAERLKFAERLDLRLVQLSDASAFAVIPHGERFDLIVSNPPWVNRRPKTLEEYALYDENFALLRSLLRGARFHLNPGGRILLAYGCVDAIRTVQRLAREYKYEVKILDDRSLDDLPEEFLPGMLIELIP